jgi:hypothetical protein
MKHFAQTEGKDHKMRQKENYVVIGRGKAGWHARVSNISSSGGALEKYVSEAVENCLVYDADNVDYDMFWDIVVKGPMADTSLPEKTVKKFIENETRLVTDQEQFRAFDSVSLDVYETILRQLPGMKIGRVTHGRVIWE